MNIIVLCIIWILQADQTVLNLSWTSVGLTWPVGKNKKTVSSQSTQIQSQSSAHMLCCSGWLGQIWFGKVFWDQRDGAHQWMFLMDVADYRQCILVFIKRIIHRVLEAFRKCKKPQVKKREMNRILQDCPRSMKESNPETQIQSTSIIRAGTYCLTALFPQ